MAITEYTYTERYVVPGGAGAATGVDWANAFDITQVAGDMTSGRRYNLSGSFTLGASLNWAINGTTSAPVAVRGWNAAQTAVATSFSDMPSLNGAASYNMSPGNIHIWQGFRVTNMGSIAISNINADQCIFYLLEVDNAGSGGISVDNYNNISHCRIRDNTAYGVDFDLGNKVQFCQIYDNGSQGVVSPNQSNAVMGSFIARNSDDGIQFSNYGNLIALNTIDDNGAAGIDLGSTGYGTQIIGNQITNNTTYGVQGTPTNALMYNNLYNNTTAANQLTHLNDTNTEVDPSYVDIANNDYEVQTASQIGVSVPLLGDVNIGAWQENSGGGGAALGLPVMAPSGVMR